MDLEQQLNIKTMKLRFNHLPQKLVLLPKSRHRRNARLHVLELFSRLCVAPHKQTNLQISECVCAGVCVCTSNPISAFHTLPRLEAKPCNVVVKHPSWSGGFVFSAFDVTGR